MRKALLISAFALLALMLATPAFADWPARTHGGFDAATEGCAGCHTTHSGSAAKLLRYGTDTTTFCEYCHNDNTRTPYNTNTGKSQQKTDNVWVDSPAGGFGTFMGITVTSEHVLGGTIVPGGDTNLTGAFTCGSCHDPHAGAATVDAGNRLLKANPGPTAGATPSIIIDSATMVTTNYRSGFSGWCGSCHNMLNAGTDSGHTAYNTAATGNTNKFRHAMGVTLTAGTTVRTGTADLTFNKDLLTGTPLEVGADNTAGTADDTLGCITCHRAHGTKAAAPTSYSSYTSVKNDAGVGGSVLLRMDKRGVCFNCHQAATKNLPTP